ASLRAWPRRSKAAGRASSRRARSCGRQLRALPPKPRSRHTTGPPVPSRSRCSATSPGTRSLATPPPSARRHPAGVALCHHAAAVSEAKRPPIPSATILLVREDPGPLEVFMVQRHHQVDFASSALVFPGGKVDPGDRDPTVRARCRGADGLDDDALALRVAAVRET